MACGAWVAAYDHRKGSRSSRDSANAIRSASSLISKMRSRHSIRGDDPPVVEVGEDSSRGQPAVRQLLQRGHE
jgi:hypothetical protein